MSNLPANIANMATGLAQSAVAIGSAAGQLFMKMTKAGEFVYGQEEIEVEPDSQWAANPMGFQHGWVAWGDKSHGTAGKNLGEKMGPASEPIFPQADLPEVEGSWSQSIGIQMRCMSGEDEGTQVLFKSNSLGGRKAYSALLTKVVEKITSGDAAIVPIVRLANTSYKHDEYGKIYNPDFIIVEWLTMEGLPVDEEEDDDDGAAAPEAEDSGNEEPEKPKRTRKSKQVEKAEEPDPEPDPDEEEEGEDPAPRRRRRRRAA